MSQQLTLTPQLQQSIRLLQLSTVDMQQEVARMLEENPMLELSDEISFGQAESPTEGGQEGQREAGEEEQEVHGDDVMDWNGAPHGSDDENEDYPEHAALQASMREHLHALLAVSKYDERDRLIIGMLIDALDERGYMTQDLAELAELLRQNQPDDEQAITLDDLETALVQLQYLDGPGIGARDLSECLALQLKALPEDTPERDLALRLVTQHLDLVAAHDFARIKKSLRCTDDQLRAAQNLILRLNPKPGEAFDSSVADFVVPDVIVEKRGDKWRARLNSSAMPKLRVNQLYASLLHQRDEKGSMSAQLQEASWLVKSLRQRFETILQVAQAIVERQGAFLEHGEIAMRPLVLREIADELELHESTVSRATTQKYMRTPRGIYEFKYFFGSGLVTESGGICSSASIRELIKQLVSNEDPCKPLTDGRMSEILAQQGFKVARRTIAKYREAMHILPVNLRKSL